MPRNKETSDTNETQIVTTIASSPFSMEITENGETREVPAHMTNDRRYEFNQELSANAGWRVK